MFFDSVEHKYPCYNAIIDNDKHHWTSNLDKIFRFLDRCKALVISPSAIPVSSMNFYWTAMARIIFLYFSFQVFKDQLTY